MTNLDALNPTVVFECYWKFAAERQRIFYKRLAGEAPPWTDDPILRAHKFTNCYRAADRVSQYLIREVIYREGLSMEPRELVFRVLLFKLFNSIEAWQILTNAFGTPEWKTFNAATYGNILGEAKAQGAKIWNNAYMQKPQTGSSLDGKHNRYLALLDVMMRGGVPDKLLVARTYEGPIGCFELTLRQLEISWQCSC